jgi:hypothetical protein
VRGRPPDACTHDHRPTAGSDEADADCRPGLRREGATAELIVLASVGNPRHEQRERTGTHPHSRPRAAEELANGALGPSHARGNLAVPAARELALDEHSPLCIGQ